MNDIMTFANSMFGEVRCIKDENGEAWFVANDIAKSLGYSNYRKAIMVHVDEDDKRVTKWNTPGGDQFITLINEAGVYSLIFSSKLPAAKEFKRWVTHDVLPSIRATGSYTLPNDEYSKRLAAVNTIFNDMNNLYNNAPTFTDVCNYFSIDPAQLKNILISKNIIDPAHGEIYPQIKKIWCRQVNKPFKLGESNESHMALFSGNGFYNVVDVFTPEGVLQIKELLGR